jgi:hypothetical protein
MTNAPQHADQIGGTATQLLVRDCLETESVADDRTPALERLEESLGGQMTKRLLCALSGDHRMRAGGPLLDGSSSP